MLSSIFVIVPNLKIYVLTNCIIKDILFNGVLLFGRLNNLIVFYEKYYLGAKNIIWPIN